MMGKEVKCDLVKTKTFVTLKMTDSVWFSHKTVHTNTHIWGIKTTLISGSAWYGSVQNIFSTCLLSKHELLK